MIEMAISRVKVSITLPYHAIHALHASTSQRTFLRTSGYSYEVTGHDTSKMSPIVANNAPLRAK